MTTRGSWTIEKDVSGVWTADGTIYPPNQNLSIDNASTKVKMRLADGSVAFVTPETKTNYQPLTFQWLEIVQSDTFRTKIENYVINQNYLRITTDLSETITGYFVNVRRVWLVGIDDTYDIEAIFERDN